MARTVPVVPTEVPGNFNTGALWNANVKATGDWLLGSGGNGVPRFKGWQGTAQTIATGTVDTAITLDSEDYDSDGGHSTVTNTSRYTIQVAGTYRVILAGGFSTNATGNRKLGLNINNGNARAASIQTAGIASNSWNACVAAEIPCIVGDYLEMVMWQTSGANLTTAIAVGFGPAMSVCWISG